MTPPKIKVLLTEDQAMEVLDLLDHAVHKAEWVDANANYRERGKKIALFRRRIANLIRVELAKS